MQYYQELTLLPDCEMSVNFIWSKLYQKLHLLLVISKNVRKENIGISFPQYTCNDDEKIMQLGNKMRIFADKREALDNLSLKEELNVYQDYIHVTTVRKVPSTCHEYAIYKRYHVEGSIAQKARRYARRHNISDDEAFKLFPMDKRGWELPFVRLKSSTNGNVFRLYIQRKKTDSQIIGEYSSYGLSNRASVPEF